MAYNLPRERQLEIIHLLVEGNSIRSVERLTRTHRDTIMRLGVRIGQRCREFLDGRMRNLALAHVEIDEIWTFVRKKQGRLTALEASNPLVGDQYVFIGIDETTKLIPSFAIGKRTKETTDIFSRDLARRLVLPELFEPGERPMLSTDGFPAYRDSLDDAFAGRAYHGVIIKNYAEAEQPGRYGPPTLAGTERRVINGPIEEDEICTSHIERHNLNIRTFLRRFTRLALGFSKKLENLCAIVALYVAHYNFCRRHGTLRMTPAMKAGIAGHPWTLDELVTEVDL